MNMDNFGLLFAQQPLNISAGFGGPKRMARQADLPETSGLLDFPVAPLIENYLVSGVLEHLSFLLKNDVFSAGLLIRVMNEKYFHKTLSFLWPTACLPESRLEVTRMPVRCQN